MTERSNLLTYLVNASVYLGVFIFSLNLPTDPDLGWHLRYGEYFLKTGTVLRDNIFSTMMSDYKWINHSWLSDVLIYAMYNSMGFLGITLLGAGVVTLTFFFLSKAFKLSVWDKAILFPVVIYLVQNVNAVSFRSQLISYFLTAVLFYILSLYEKKPKYLLFTIPLFLIWANFHGGFVVGIALLGGYLGIKKFLEFQNKFDLKNIYTLRFELLVFAGVILATLINPFGYGVYLESFNHFGNQWLKYVSEWAPFYDLSSQWWKFILFVNLYIVGILILFTLGKIKKILPIAILLLIFMTLSFYERRYAWSMYYLSFPILLGISGFFKPKSKSTLLIASSIVTLVFLFSAIYIKEPTKNYQTMNWQRYCLNQSNLCSYGAIDFISRNKLTQNLSTPYSWGGWMIWNYPEIKPSIDGRMHLWKDRNGYSAFGEYYTNVQDWESIDKSKYDTVLVLKQKPMFKRLKKLTVEGKWRWVYEDRVSAVFVRK